MHRHPAVFTVDEAKALRGPLTGIHVKNLFLRDKKPRYFLLTVPEDRALDLKALRPLLGARGGLGFASRETLRELLGIEPGSVTPLAAINDHEGRVSVVLDATIRGYRQVNVHPNHNAATIGLAPHDLERFLEHVGHAPIWLDLDER